MPDEQGGEDEGHDDHADQPYEEGPGRPDLLRLRPEDQAERDRRGASREYLRVESRPESHRSGFIGLLFPGAGPDSLKCLEFPVNASPESSRIQRGLFTARGGTDRCATKIRSVLLAAAVDRRPHGGGCPRMLVGRARVRGDARDGWSGRISPREGYPTAASSMRCSRVPRHLSCRTGCGCGLHRQPAADRARPDDLAALYRRPDDRVPRPRATARGCSRSAPARGTRRPCSPGSPTRSSRSR